MPNVNNLRSGQRDQAHYESLRPTSIGPASGGIFRNRNSRRISREPHKFNLAASSKERSSSTRDRKVRRSRRGRRSRRRRSESSQAAAHNAADASSVALQNLQNIVYDGVPYCIRDGLSR